LVLAIANDNLSWGYTKIRDAVHVGPGIGICRSTRQGARCIRSPLPCSHSLAPRFAEQDQLV
jgi:hypothetical protein